MQASPSVAPATVAEIGERALVARITARLAPQPWVVVGPGDDAAVVAPERGALQVLTTDSLVEGVHFDRRFVPPGAIGHRALAVNLSDLAAMGAAPRGALLSLLLPPDLPVSVIDDVLDGILALAARYRVAIVGGNVTRTPGPLTIDVTAFGSVRPRRALTRAGARPGDEVFVTGTLGAAAVGLRVLRELQGNGASPEVERYLRPEPRVRAGLLLARTRTASSCMDLSDGLADAARQIADASGAGMILDADALPIPAAVRDWHARHGGDPVETALTGGDDYELVFTVRPSHRRRLRAMQTRLGDLPITRIGVVTKSRTLEVARAGVTRPLPPGYEHFR